MSDPSPDPRLTLVQDPAAADAMLAHMGGLEETGALFAWARRATLLTTLDPVPLRKLLLRADALDDVSLARWAEAAPLPWRHPLRLVGALIKRREADRTFQPPQPGTAFADFARRIDWLRFTAAAEPIPSSLASGIEVTLMKIAYSREFQDAGLTSEAVTAGREAALFSRTVRQRLYGTRVRGFTQNWTQAIGHLVIFIHLLAAHRYAMTDWEQTVLERGHIANDTLFALAESAFGPVPRIHSGKGYCEHHGSQLPEVLGGDVLDVFQVCARVDAEAAARGETVLPVPPRDGALARYLSSIGLDADAHYVTVHCREAGFKLQGVHQPRNAPIEDCLPALAHLVERGYTVIRLGDPSMSPLPEMAGVIDYARAPEKTPELDILLPAHAAFHIGSSSGLSLVPLLFGRPCLFVNWYPINMLPWGRRTWTLLKRLVDTRTAETVTDAETLTTVGRVTDTEMLEHLGYALHNNTKEETLETVRDFESRYCDESHFSSPEHYLYNLKRNREQVLRVTEK